MDHLDHHLAEFKLLLPAYT